MHVSGTMYAIYLGYGNYACSMHRTCTFHAWNMHISCMEQICFMHGKCQFHACSMHVTCMERACSMHETGMFQKNSCVFHAGKLHESTSANPYMNHACDLPEKHPNSLHVTCMTSEDLHEKPHYAILQLKISCMNIPIIHCMKCAVTCLKHACIRRSILSRGVSPPRVCTSIYLQWFCWLQPSRVVKT